MTINVNIYDHRNCQEDTQLRDLLLIIIKKLDKMADQNAEIKALVQQGVDTLTDLVTSEQNQDKQLDLLIQTAEDIKNNEASGADQTDTVNALTSFVGALKTARDASKAQTDKVQAALTVLQTPVSQPPPPPPPPTTTDKTYSDAAGDTIVVSQAGTVPALGDAVLVNGAAPALATYTLTDGAVLNIGTDGKVASYTPAAQ